MKIKNSMLDNLSNWLSEGIESDEIKFIKSYTNLLNQISSDFNSVTNFKKFINSIDPKIVINEIVSFEEAIEIIDGVYKYLPIFNEAIRTTEDIILYCILNNKNTEFTALIVVSTSC